MKEHEAILHPELEAGLGTLDLIVSWTYCVNISSVEQHFRHDRLNIYSLAPSHRRLDFGICAFINRRIIQVSNGDKRGKKKYHL